MLSADVDDSRQEGSEILNESGKSWNEIESGNGNLRVDDGEVVSVSASRTVDAVAWIKD